MRSQPHESEVSNDLRSPERFDYEGGGKFSTKDANQVMNTKSLRRKSRCSMDSNVRIERDQEDTQSPNRVKSKAKKPILRFKTEHVIRKNRIKIVQFQL
jgi:hypothetical protein